MYMLSISPTFSNSDQLLRGMFHLPRPSRSLAFLGSLTSLRNRSGSNLVGERCKYLSEGQRRSVLRGGWTDSNLTDVSPALHTANLPPERFPRRITMFRRQTLDKTRGPDNWISSQKPR